MKNIKEIVESPVVKYLATILAAFMMGFGAREKLIHVNNQKVIANDEYTNLVRIQNEHADISNSLQLYKKAYLDKGLNSPDDLAYTFWDFRTTFGGWATILLLPNNRVLYGNAPVPITQQDYNNWSFDGNRVVINVNFGPTKVEYVGTIDENGNIINGTATGSSPMYRPEFWKADRVAFLK